MATVHESRKKISESPKNDFYQTPKCVTWELINNYLKDFNKDITILDPCCGLYAIGNELRASGFNNITEKDLSYGDNFLEYDGPKSDLIIMNPPFKNFDKIVQKAKQYANIVCSVGRLNFFGAHNRNVNGLWDHLKYVFIFDRQLAYDRPFREDGKVECGMLISCWFIWDNSYDGDPMIKLIDMQKYIVSQKNTSNNFINLWEEKE